MASVYDVDPRLLIEAASKELQRNPSIRPPLWSKFVKTGNHKERQPARSDWWFVRAAAVLKTIYSRGPVGVSKLSVKYGGKKRRGAASPKFTRGSGSILRKVLQQLESAGYVKQSKTGVHKGRVVTPEGKSFLDRIAISIMKGSGKQKETAQ